MTMEERILAVMRRVFNDDSIDYNCSQKSCKSWDSMNQLNLVVELEMEFDISLEPEEIGAMVTFEDVVKIVKAKLS